MLFQVIFPVDLSRTFLYNQRVWVPLEQEEKEKEKSGQ